MRIHVARHCGLNRQTTSRTIHLPIVTGTAFYHRYSCPKIEDNVFTRNGGNGISVARSAQGEIRNNVFQVCLAIGGTSEPLWQKTKLSRMQTVYVSDSARPVLRNNVIEKTSGWRRQPLMLNPISAAQKVKVNIINGRYEFTTQPIP